MLHKLCQPSPNCGELQWVARSERNFPTQVLNHRGCCAAGLTRIVRRMPLVADGDLLGREGCDVSGFVGRFHDKRVAAI